MACESKSNIPTHEPTDSSTWSSDTENQQESKPKVVISKLPEQKIPAEPKSSKKKKRPISVCLTHCRYEVIRKVAQRFGYRECCDGENWNLYWTDLSITVERCKEMKRFQKINHFPGMLEICRKDLLARNLGRMQRMFPRDYNFFPKTWCFPADLGDAVTYARIRKNKTFILKPDAGSQGRGIIITKSLKDIRPSDKGICQVYISKPFLIDGYKFDLRVYTLITSCDPLRIYVYNEGLVRFATSQYKEPNGVNISNVFMHLTNYAVNKHSRTYNQDIDGSGSKRKLTWFNHFLRTMKFDVPAIWTKIDDVIIKTIVSAYPVLKHSYAACFPNHDVIPACCELLGIDIIFDRKMNPLVLEVNHSPSFHTDTTLDQEVKESLLGDMFAMMNLEKLDKRRIMREDRKRIRERLLHGSKDKDVPAFENRSFHEYFKNEIANRGGFRLVYPNTSSDHTYGKFFDQGQNTLYCDTVSSRAREQAQTALRGEMILRQKLEAAKRVVPLIKSEKPSSEVSSSTQIKPAYKVEKPRKPPSPFYLHSNNARGSFIPQQIIDSEEKERLRKMAQRDYLLRSHGILEHVYFSLKKNKVLRPQDDKKYSIFNKMRQAAQVTNENRLDTGPKISNLVEDLQNLKNSGAGEFSDKSGHFVVLKKELVQEWSQLNKTQAIQMYTEVDPTGNVNLKYFSSSVKL